MARSCTNWYLLQSRSFESNLRCHCIVRGRFNTLKLPLFRFCRISELTLKVIINDFELSQRETRESVGMGVYLAPSILVTEPFHPLTEKWWWCCWYKSGCPGNLVYIHVSHCTRRVKSNCDLVCYTVTVTYRTTAVDQTLGLNLRGIDLSFEANATKRKLIWARYNV